MRNMFLMAAVAASAIALSGCDHRTDYREDVTVTVTSPANVRDAPTTDGSNVLETLNVGTKLTGKWVSASNGTEGKWLEVVRNGKTAFVWADNTVEEAIASSNKLDESAATAVDELANIDGGPSEENRVRLERIFTCAYAFGFTSELLKTAGDVSRSDAAMDFGKRWHVVGVKIATNNGVPQNVTKEISESAEKSLLDKVNAISSPEEKYSVYEMKGLLEPIDAECINLMKRDSDISLLLNQTFK